MDPPPAVPISICAISLPCREFCPVVRSCDAIFISVENASVQLENNCPDRDWKSSDRSYQFDGNPSELPELELPCTLNAARSYNGVSP